MHSNLRAYMCIQRSIYRRRTLPDADFQMAFHSRINYANNRTKTLTEEKEKERECVCVCVQQEYMKTKPKKTKHERRWLYDEEKDVPRDEN